MTTSNYVEEKGTILVFPGGGSAAVRLPPGADGKALILDSTTFEGVRWGGPDSQGDFPITPFVVGSSDTAGYEDLDDAVTAAEADGGMIFLQAGTHLVTNLAIPDGVTLWGDGSGKSIISGILVPPTTGLFYAQGLQFLSATHALNSSAAGTADIAFDDCYFLLTTGYQANLPNWTGNIDFFVCGDLGSTNNGIINNTGGSDVTLQSITLGAGSSNPLIVSGVLTINNGYIYCPQSFQTGTVFSITSSGLVATSTLGNNSTGFFNHCYWFTEANSAITMSSSASVYIYNSTINSSNIVAIAGAGAGTLTLGTITYTQSSGVSVSLTLAYAPTTTGNLTIGGALNGLNFPNLPVTSAGASPRTCNGRVGVVTFSSVSIAAGATQSLVITNSQITSNNQHVHLSLVGATTGAALTIQSYATASSGNTITIVVINGTGATTTTANITFTFIILD